MDALDSYWLRVAEDEVYAYGFRPFEEIRVQCQAVDEESSAPLNITYTVRPHKSDLRVALPRGEKTEGMGAPGGGCY